MSEENVKEISQEKVRKIFDSWENESKCEEDKFDKIVENILDIRKFEIELYWHRAAYYFAFITALGVAYFNIFSIENHEFSKKLGLPVISILIVISSFCWVLANRGSKFWQENWEDLLVALEDKSIGPLYEITKNHFLEPKSILEGRNFSLSKINMIISLSIFAASVILLFFTIIYCFFYNEIQNLFLIQKYDECFPVRCFIGLFSLYFVFFILNLILKTTEGLQWQKTEKKEHSEKDRFVISKEVFSRFEKSANK